MDEKYYFFDRYKGKTKMAAGIKILATDIVEATEKAEKLKDREDTIKFRGVKT